MANTNTINLNLTQHEILQLTLALNHVIFDMRHELDEKDTTADRKKVLLESVEMWGELKNKIKTQFDEQNI